MTALPTPPLWPGPRLLVPITLDALVLGVPNRNQTWVDLSVNYANLLQNGSATSQPFSTGNAPPTGIHLLWALPWGVRQGQSGEGDGLSFPFAPNRWAILRSYVASAGATPQWTAWILESDFLGDSPPGTNTFPDPENPAGQIQFLGRQYELSAWRGGNDTGAPFLQAVGPGDVSYANIYTNVGNVFAFHDSPPDNAQGTYSYVVCGWYSPTSSDPLLGTTAGNPSGWSTPAGWQALMDRFGWQVGDGSAQALAAAQQAWQAWQQTHGSNGGGINPEQLLLPAQVLCHGAVFGVAWQGSGTFYPQSIPGSTGVQVAVGNSPSEALSAWLAKVLGDPGAERLFEAFQRDQIFQFADDPTRLEDLIHTNQFSTGSGGLGWSVIRPQEADADKGHGAAEQDVELDSDSTQLLTQLNAAQRTFDLLGRARESQQWELFSAWYKLQRVDPRDPKLQQQIQDAITALQASIAQLQTDQTKARTDRDTARKSLEARLGTKRVLRSFELPRYAQPADPVILVAGANADDKLAKPGTFDDSSGSLVCRLTGQPVTGLQISFESSSATVTAQQVQAAVPLPSSSGPLPKELLDLWTELILLDPSAAGFLAKLFFQQAGVSNPTAQQLQDLTQLIAQQQTAVWNAALDPALDAQALADAVGIVGTPPAALAFQAQAQPWTPMYLDWQVTWFPTSTSPADALATWRLGETDFEWTASSVPTASQTYSGRTLINLQAARGLQQQLTAFLETSPSLARLPAYQVAELKNAVNQMGQFDLITQDLTGMTQQLMMRQVAITSPVSDKDVATSVGNASTYVPTPSAPFTPLRSGHLLINRLWVVDAFGQRMPAAPDGSNVTPIRAETVTTPGNNNAAYVQLPPRYAQPARLDFALLQADDDRIRSNSSSQTNPVGGYILPNYLDGSLTVFDAAGLNLGAVQPVVRDAGDGVRWDAVPGSSDPLGAPPSIGNAHVASMVNGLLTAGLNGVDALSELLDLMDALQWMMDPTGQQEEGNLEALVGRPLAVVRASLALQLQGGPVYDQGYKTTGQQVTNGFEKVAFPVRIGDLGLAENGVVGYFVNDDYGKLYSVHGYKPVTKGLRAALRRAPGLRRASLQRLARAPERLADANGAFVIREHLVDLPADGTTVHLTVLLAPRASLPAITGALPVQRLALLPGPTTRAFRNMEVTFRVGPLLTDPKQLRMPLPAEVRGEWSWVRREDVTVWSDDAAILEDNGIARLVQRPLQLNQGWLKLSGALQKS